LQTGINIYFSDFFEVSSETVEQYGAFDIALINDLPMFVDPFLLFNSDNEAYRHLHDEIIRYMRFLRDVSLTTDVPEAHLWGWFTFPEIKQNWLGFSKKGNKGHGLGLDFAANLSRNLKSVFSNFGDEKVTVGSHLEKLCLIRHGVGRDNVSDFTTNLILNFLASYTQEFAVKHISSKLRKRVAVRKTSFNYVTRTWATKSYELPFINGDYVLLTPRDILTKDDTWISRSNLLYSLEDIAYALPNYVLRAQVNQYLMEVIPRDTKKKKATQEEKNEAYGRVIERFPEILDYYIRDKEDHGDEAKSVSEKRVAFIQKLFVDQIRNFVNNYLAPAEFYKIGRDTHEEAKERLLFLKNVIENKGGHRVFYIDGQPVERESDLHIMFLFTWFGSHSVVSHEVNDGRGPVDFKISRGASDKTLVEFKLAKNPQLERNLQKQIVVYEAASDPTHPSLKAILYFSDEQLKKVNRILDRLKLNNSPHIVLIDARADNKPSGSKA